MPGASCKSCFLGRDLVQGLAGQTDRPRLLLVTDNPRNGDNYFTAKERSLLLESLAKHGFSDRDVALTADLCCRPDNVKQMPAALMNFCRSRLLAEIEAVSPMVVLLLGPEATKTVLGPSKARFDRRRGVVKNGILATYHPAAVLKDARAQQTREIWRDWDADIALACRVANGEQVVVEPPYDEYEEAATLKAFDKALIEMSKQTQISVDLETDGFDFREGTIRLIGFSWAEGQALVVPWRIAEQRLDEMDKVLSRAECIFQNGQFDVPWLHRYGVHPNFAFDTLLAHFLLDERRMGHNLQSMAVAFCKAPDWKTQLDDKFGSGAYATIPHGDLVRYNGADADYTFRLGQVLRERLKEEGLEYAFDEILVPAARHFTKLRETGMLIDMENLEAFGDRLKAEIADLETELRAFPGAGSLNFRAPAQLQRYLFDTLGLLPFGGQAWKGRSVIPEDVVLESIRSVEDPEAQEFWRSKRGLQKGETGFDARSTDAYTLWWLAQQHDFPRVLLRYRKKIKYLDSYYQRVHDHLWPDGRVRPVYRLWGAKTGRVSSVDPAIHNLPRDPEIWNFFRADPGMTLVYADYSQVELRVAAHMSGDPDMIQMLNEGDVHAEVAKRMFRCTEEEWERLPKDVRTERRTAAKGINFGVLYGRTAKGLAPQLGVTLNEADNYIRAYYESMPRLKNWIEKQKRRATLDGYAVSLFGRRRRFPWSYDDTHYRELMRQATNMPVQSTASDLTMMAQMKIVAALEEQGIEVHVWPHIHDSMTIAVPDDFVPMTCDLVRDIMTKQIPFETEVEFDIDLKVGKHWGNIKEVKA